MVKKDKYGQTPMLTGAINIDRLVKEQIAAAKQVGIEIESGPNVSAAAVCSLMSACLSWCVVKDVPIDEMLDNMTHVFNAICEESGCGIRILSHAESAEMLMKRTDPVEFVDKVSDVKPN